MKILVTGANGFVGAALCQKLLEAEHDVVAVVRKKSSFSLSSKLTILKISNIGPRTDWSVAKLSEIDVVIHLASRVHITKEQEKDPKKAFMRVNCEGAKQLAIAAINNGVKRFVFISTAHIHGHCSGDIPFTEESPANPESDYAYSKWEAEKTLQKLFGKNTNSHMIIIRPPLV
jgi:nucleoside-diphosphate-sugar epimerase